MYKERIIVTPQFKLTFAGNHAPNFGAVDNAIRRRLIVVPFDHIPEQPDLQLDGKLRAEWPGILQWMINGCLEWQRIGLQVPVRLQAATNDYLSDQDTFGEWFEDCCEITTDDVCTSSADLYGSWCAFAQERGEHPGNFRGLAERMKRATGMSPKQIKSLNGRGYRGVRLKGP
jgi:putative DNA primase/helicase